MQPLSSQPCPITDTQIRTGSGRAAEPALSVFLLFLYIVAPAAHQNGNIFESSESINISNLDSQGQEPVFSVVHGFLTWHDRQGRSTISYAYAFVLFRVLLLTLTLLAPEAMSLGSYAAQLAPYTAFIKPYSTYVTPYVGYVPTLLAPIHPNFPFAPLDVVGAMRLSSVINWIASGVFDPPAASKGGRRARATLLRELTGLMIVIFGPETFLGMVSGTTPSWLVSLKLPFLFCATHAIQTRTPLRKLLPRKPSLALELAFAIPDAIGRSLLLTKFSILPLLRPTALTPSIPPTPASLLLVPFILAVPFASLAFSTFNLFAPEPHLTTPLELRPGGWMFADTFVPFVVPALFLSLIGPVQGWSTGLGVGEDEAVVICAVVTSAIFLGRAVYNFGHEAASLFGVADRRKIKTA